MRPEPRNRAIPLAPSLLSLIAAAGLALALPRAALADTVQLATVPMQTSTSTTVQPNLMFMLDDSGSMAWDYLPDNAANFAGDYGYNSSQCNGVYYNPDITYSAPVDSSGNALNSTATSFTAAYKDGYNTSSGTVDLNTKFTGGSGSGSSGISLTAGPAFWYDYSGTQTTGALKNYFDSSTTFYKECNSSIGSSPGSGVFTLHRLASVPTTTITVTNGGSGGATLTITNAGSYSNQDKLTSLTVNDSLGNTYQLLNATTNSSRKTSTLAGYIQAAIHACATSIPFGSRCTVAGFDATVSGSTVTITAPASLPGGGLVAGQALSVTLSGGCTSSSCYTKTAFPNANNTDVSSITVGGTQLLSATATASTAATLATAVASNINASTGTTGYSAVASSNVVTITAPTSASNLTPAITSGPHSGCGCSGMTLTTLAFPDSDPTQLQNFANWYSYYSNRMLMMKTGAGLAFAKVGTNYRVGFMTMNNNVSPDFVAVDTFDAAQKSSWYGKLYAAKPSNSTPLREALSHVGQYYAHLYGAVTSYTATITVSGNGSTSVSSIQVNGVELMNDDSLADNDTGNVASNISDQINAPQVTDYGASSDSNVITITGPATALGATPVITDDGGGMTFAATAFSASTSTAKINNTTPPDPVQYSCQQNFVLLSTDGYWNGSHSYDLNNNDVGQQDGTADRPYWDGAQSVTTYTAQFTRNNYSATSNRISALGGSNCSSGKRVIGQPQICSATKTGSAPTANDCSSWSNNGTAFYVSPFTNSSGTCVSSSAATAAIPSPNPGVATQSSLNSTAGTTGGASSTLADVAMYYYQTDLRDNLLGNCTGALGTSVCEDNVFVSSTDDNRKQHLTTFTLGLGVRGNMVYSSSYLTDTSGDYVDVKLGTTADSTHCTWQSSGTVCNWPVPTSGNQSTVDDLWHAAVNGRGVYYSAGDPNELSNGLANALVSISSKVGAAAAAATSTLNPVAGNNEAFVASYTTLQWTGNLEARGINTDTGVVNVNDDWCIQDVASDTCASPSTVVSDTSGDTTTYYCSTPNSVACPNGTLDSTNCLVPMATACTGTMDAMVTATSDTRTIYTASDAGTTLTAFDTTYQAAHAAWFGSTVLSGLSQWPACTGSGCSLTQTYLKTNAPGANLMNYLRGQYGHEVNRTVVDTIDQFFRNRSAVMGDALESQPAFLGAPVFSYPYAGYSTFKSTQSANTDVTNGTVYIGTNDGMLHAFNSKTGVERWAYVPTMVIPNMWKLADENYANLHTNYVNGSPITSDVCVSNCTDDVNAVWKTILVGGLNGGGRGYYALDITDPTAPKLLWEFTPSKYSDGTTSNAKVKDDDLGYSYGQAIITQKNDGTWVVVVTSGYDNGTSGPDLANQQASGDGIGYLYVLNANTGAIISKISTGAGTASAPSGLAKVGGFNGETSGNKVTYIYGGDLLGNLWRFDINDTATSATIGKGSAFKFATLFGDSSGSQPQPVMTTPILGTILGKRVVFVGTGKYLETSDLSTAQTQTQYAIKDDDVSSTIVNPRVQGLVQQYLIDNPDGTATRLSAASATATSQGSNSVNFGVDLGWFVDFPASGERVNIDASLVSGTLIVSTIVPSSTSCTPGGFGWLNFLNYATGGAVLTPGLSGVRLDSTIVGVNVLYISGNPVVEVVTSTNPTPTINPNVQFSATSSTFAGQRVLWRELLP